MDELYNINIERTVLASFLFYPETFYDNKTSVYDFYLPAHRDIYEAMCNLDSKEDPVCEDFIKIELQKLNKWNEAAMLDVMSTNPIPSIAEYVKELQKYASYRYFLALGTQVKHKVSKREDVHEIADYIARKNDAIVDNTVGTDTKNLRDFTIEFECKMKQALEAVDNITGYTTGIQTLDNKTGGFEPGELVVIAGRPGMGKTAMGVTLANNFDLKNVGVLFDSLEMDGDKIVRRLIACRADEKMQDLKCGLTANFAASAQVIKDVKESKNIILHRLSYPSIEQLCAKAGKVFRKNPHVKIWIIDHLLQIRRKSLSSFETSNEISVQLANIIKTAGEYGVVPIVLHQLSRESEAKNNKRPSLKDLAQSISIEQLASWVIFPFRPSYYEAQESNHPEPKFAPCELIIAKARDGQIGVAECFFAGQHSRFQSYIDGYTKEMGRGNLL